MTDATHAPAHAHDDEHPHPNYILVFLVLCVLTAVSFWTVQEELWRFGAEAGHTLVMIVAVVKALLVALFFMHLKYDWFKVYAMVVGALVLGTVIVVALLPDMTFSQTNNLVGRPPPVLSID